MLFYKYRLRPVAGWEGKLPENPPPDHWRQRTQEIILALEKDGPDFLFAQVTRMPLQATADFRLYCLKQDIPIGLLKRDEITATEFKMMLRCSNNVDHENMLCEYGPLGYLPFLCETPHYEFVADFDLYRTEQIQLAKAARSRCPQLAEEIRTIHAGTVSSRDVYVIKAEHERTIRQRAELLVAARHSQGWLPSGRVCVVRPLSIQMPMKKLSLLYREQRDATVLVLLDQSESMTPFLDDMIFFRLGALAEQYSRSVCTVFAVNNQTQKLMDLIEKGIVSVKLKRLGWEQSPVIPPEPPPEPPLELPPEESEPPKAPKSRKRAASKEKAPAPPSGKSAFEELQSLTGLSELKEAMTQLVDYHRAETLFKQRGLLPQKPAGFHMVFYGAAGSGKTTAARLVARILKEEGILSKGQLIEVERSDLVAGYVGQTALKTRKVLEKAKGGVVFIDEAYTLTTSQSDNDYGSESIACLLKTMEDVRQDLVVIVAGYDQLMRDFLKSNPGLKSRFFFHINFPEYSLEQLYEILKKKLEDNHRCVRPEDEPTIREHIRLAMKQENFGNARFIRSFLEQALLKQASRLMRLPPEQVTEEEIRLLTLEDFPEVKAQVKEQKLRQIGFRY